MRRDYTILSEKEMDNLQTNLGIIIDNLKCIKNGEHTVSIDDVIDQAKTVKEMITLEDEITELEI